MNKSARSILFLLLMGLSPTLAESSDYLLFSPRPFEGELLMPERGKGVLVQRITIKRGDTLSQISRDFSGKGSYFPQILLFNDIANPDRIFAGKELMVPVSRQDAPANTSIQGGNSLKSAKKDSVRKSEPAVTAGSKAIVPAKKKQRPAANQPTPKKQIPDSGPFVHRGEQDSYARALRAYRNGEYSKSLSLFSRFLEQYPSSSLASDASLYKAESLLKLSGQ